MLLFFFIVSTFPLTLFNIYYFRRYVIIKKKDYVNKQTFTYSMIADRLEWFFVIFFLSFEKISVFWRKIIFFYYNFLIRFFTVYSRKDKFKLFPLFTKLWQFHLVSFPYVTYNWKKFKKQLTLQAIPESSLFLSLICSIIY